jgi:hypothetical protein
MKPPLSTKSSDDFQTPPEALDYLLPYIPDTIKIIWECASGVGYLANALCNAGYKVICSDINPYNQHTLKINFLVGEIPEPYDMIITNPPYKYKNQFIKRCYELGKPFALLMPLTTLESRERQILYAKYGITLIIPDKRINFMTPSGRGSSSWFATAWYTWGILPDNQIIFTVGREIGKNSEKKSCRF